MVETLYVQRTGILPVLKHIPSLPTGVQGLWQGPHDDHSDISQSPGQARNRSSVNWKINKINMHFKFKDQELQNRKFIGNKNHTASIWAEILKWWVCHYQTRHWPAHVGRGCQRSGCRRTLSLYCPDTPAFAFWFPSHRSQASQKNETISIILHEGFHVVYLEVQRWNGKQKEQI